MDEGLGFGIAASLMAAPPRSERLALKLTHSQGGGIATKTLAGLRPHGRRTEGQYPGHLQTGYSRREVSWRDFWGWAARFSMRLKAHCRRSGRPTTPRITICWVRRGVAWLVR